MRGVNAGFVCKQYHRANTRHTCEEGTAAVNLPKKRHPQATFIVEDIAAVVEMTLSSDDDADDAVENEVQWAEAD